MKDRFASAFEHIPAWDIVPPAACLLVKSGSAEAHLPEHEITLSIQLKSASTLEAEANHPGVRARFNHKVVLQLSLIAVIDQIDARIDVLVPYLGVSGHVSAPSLGIVPDEIISRGGQSLEPGDFRSSIGPY